MDASCHDDEFPGTRLGAMVAAFSHMTVICSESAPDGLLA